MIDDVAWSFLRFRLRLILDLVCSFAGADSVRFSFEMRGFFNEYELFVCDRWKSSVNAVLLVDDWDLFCGIIGEFSSESVIGIEVFDKLLKIFPSSASDCWSLSFSGSRLRWCWIFSGVVSFEGDEHDGTCWDCWYVKWLI